MPAGDVEDRWTLRAADRTLLGNKSGATRLGFAVLLKLFQAEGRFPRRPEDVPLVAVEAIAAQVGVPAAAWHRYDWHGRAIRYHRVQIRTALGFREARGWLRIRPRMTYKPGGGAARAHLVISPMIPRLAWPAILP